MRDHVALPDGSALVVRLDCPGCGQSVTRFHGVLWDDNDTPHECVSQRRHSVRVIAVRAVCVLAAVAAVAMLVTAFRASANLRPGDVVCTEHGSLHCVRVP